MTGRGHQQRVFGACMPSSNSVASLPKGTRTSDRRRSQRRQLRQPMTVALHAVGENEDWRIRGALLNLSPDGMACRVSQEDTSLLQVGGTVLLRFRLGDAPPFEFLACANNIIEAGTPGHMVVGLEFANAVGLACDRNRLRSLLEGVPSIAE